MNLHPLTPRKPALLATTVSAATVILTIAIGIVIHFVLLPPVAWLPAHDAYETANARFVLDVVASLLGPIFAQHSWWAKIDGVLTLPQAILDTITALDLTASLAVRVSAISLAALYVGMETNRLVLTRATAQPSVRHIKGPKLLTGRIASSSLLAAWHRRYGADEPGIVLANSLIMPRRLETDHILICGGTGAGKTTILQTMMNGMIERGDKMLALDVKGDVTAKLPIRNAALLALDDIRSRRWDLGHDVVSCADAEELAIELIPETSDPSWSAGARRVLACLIGFLQDSYRSGRRWSWRELEQLLSSSIEVLHRTVLERDTATAEFLDYTRDETRKQAMSFYLVLLANALPVVSACARMGSSKGPGFSFRQWIGHDKAPQVLILRQSQHHPELSATIARIGLKFVADAAAGRTADAAPKPVWLMLDELPQLGKTSAVPRLAAIGRSAGIRLVVTLQSPAQMREIYGAEGAQHLLDNLTTKIIGRITTGKTATDIAENWIGKRTVEYWEQSARGAHGSPGGERRIADILTVDPGFLVGELGLTASLTGTPFVRALVIGHGDVCLLDWPVGLWPDRRPAQVMRPIPARITKSGS